MILPGAFTSKKIEIKFLWRSWKIAEGKFTEESLNYYYEKTFFRLTSVWLLRTKKDANKTNLASKAKRRCIGAAGDVIN